MLRRCSSDTQEKNLLQVVRDLAPDIIALGYDQGRPPGLDSAFPSCEIVVLDPHHPERFKSSFIRKPAHGKKSSVFQPLVKKLLGLQRGGRTTAAYVVPQ